VRRPKARTLQPIRPVWHRLGKLLEQRTRHSDETGLAGGVMRAFSWGSAPSNGPVMESWKPNIEGREASDPCRNASIPTLVGCDRAGARDYAAFLGFFFLEPS